MLEQDQALAPQDAKTARQALAAIDADMNATEARIAEEQERQVKRRWGRERLQHIVTALDRFNRDIGDHQS